MGFLEFIHNATTMMFGILLSAFLLGVKQNRKNYGILDLFFAGVGILYLICSYLFGDAAASRMYPLLIHLPLVIFLTYYYKYPKISCMLSVLTSYLLCQISNWTGLVILAGKYGEDYYYGTRILVTILIFLIVTKWICPTTAILFGKGNRILCVMGFLPFVYYIFDNITTKYSALLYSGNKIVAEFMSFVFCISYLVFLIIYYKEYEEKYEASQYSKMMELQLSSIQNEITQTKQAEEVLAILRHDMHHHLNVILTQLESGHHEDAMEYIKMIEKTNEKPIIQRYCKNERINAILSMYQANFAQQKIACIWDISIRDKNQENDIAICAILSNALENVMHALENLQEEQRWVRLNMSDKAGHLLIRIENPFDTMPIFTDGIPISPVYGHGIGVKSILYYVEKMKGQCDFSISGKTFLLRVIL